VAIREIRVHCYSCEGRNPLFKRLRKSKFWWDSSRF